MGSAILSDEMTTILSQSGMAVLITMGHHGHIIRRLVCHKVTFFPFVPHILSPCSEVSARHFIFLWTFIIFLPRFHCRQIDLQVRPSRSRLISIL